jgi:predicted PurR-regulated permease PerM
VTRPRASSSAAAPQARSEFLHRTIAVIGLVSLAVLLAAVVTIAADVLLVFFGGVLFAVFLRGVAELISRRVRIEEKTAVIVVIVAGALLLGLASWLLAAEVTRQLQQIGTDLTGSWQQMRQRLESAPWGRQMLAMLSQAQSTSSENGEMTARVAQIFSTTLGGIVNLFIIVFIGVYVALNPRWYERGMLRLIPPAGRGRARELLGAIGHTLRWWLFGRAVGMLVVGIITTVGLLLLGVPFALGLGVIAALLDFVPIVGPILAAAPAILVALGTDVTLALYTVMLYLGIQFLEGYVLTPLIEQRSVALAPALTIGAQVLLGVLIGALGVVFATPLSAAIVVLVTKLYVEDTLEQPAGEKHQGHR